MDLGEIWDKILEELDYLIHFEWLSDVGGFFVGFFENINEISPLAVIFGIVGVVLTNITIGKLDFVTHQSGVTQIMWRGILSVFSFVLTYFMTRRALNM